MHHLTLKKAVEKYSKGIPWGKTKEELTTDIKADPKGFSEEEVNEILKAIEAGGKQPPSQDDKPKPERHVVSSEFRDHLDFNKKWEVGHDVSHFSKKRLEKLVELDLVKVL